MINTSEINSIKEIEQLKADREEATQSGFELITAQTRLQSLLHHASDGIITISPNGELQSFNIAAQQIFGYSESEVVTQQISHLIPCPDWAENNVAAYIRDFLLNRSSEYETLLGHHKDGSVISLQISTGEVATSNTEFFEDTLFDDDDDDGGAGGDFSKEILVCFLRDVSIQKKQEQELLELRDSLEAVAIVAKTDAKGRITYVNDKFCAISQYSREELIGQDHRILNSGTHPKSLWTGMYRQLAASKTWSHTICNRAKDGSLYWVETTIIAYTDDKGKPTHYIAIKTDVTQQKTLENSLLELVAEQTKSLRESKEAAEMAQAQAEAANHAKSEFLANMSHELRTPMHSILSFSKFGTKQITKTPLEQKGIDKVIRFLANITESGERLMSLLNDLLDLAKLEAGKMTYDFRSRDLKQSVEAILTEFSTKLDEKQLKLTLEIQAKSTSAYYDHDKIAQVIANVTSNAIKFTAEESEIKIILSDADNKEERLLFSIYDQGIGVPEEELKTIFDQFIQSSKTDTGAGGTGLGLAICKEIISEHNGLIWAENNFNTGAVIKFTLPKEAKDEGTE